MSLLQSEGMGLSRFWKIALIKNTFRLIRQAHQQFDRLINNAGLTISGVAKADFLRTERISPTAQKLVFCAKGITDNPLPRSLA